MSVEFDLYEIRFFCFRRFREYDEPENHRLEPFATRGGNSSEHREPKERQGSVLTEGPRDDDVASLRLRLGNYGNSINSTLASTAYRTEFSAVGPHIALECTPHLLSPATFEYPQCPLSSPSTEKEYPMRKVNTHSFILRTA